MQVKTLQRLRIRKYPACPESVRTLEQFSIECRIYEKSSRKDRPENPRTLEEEQPYYGYTSPPYTKFGGGIRKRNE
ncbi:14929_t:CDS:2 [Cetraspora pellucida]|uniref:14929_t:CDS:1 n=1 Tax=Cetraspora pellucida TaxID=1433469 RepID=A0ACA9N148_9GLOM|nr:14929_t:CDS:2 [Cetraspora pellucida]